MLLNEGKTSLLAAVSTVASMPRRGKQLLVDYRERQISFGKFIAKRERDTDREVAISSAVEQTLHALLPPSQGNKDIQVVVTLLSSEGLVDSDVHVFNAASAALGVSPVPWAGPMAAVRVAQLLNGFEINPSFPQVCVWLRGFSVDSRHNNLTSPSLPPSSSSFPW